jgi:hypothetical protein
MKIYREVAKVVSDSEVTREIVLDETTQLLKQFATTIRREVPILKEESDRHYERRRIGGYQYHLYSADPRASRAVHSYGLITDLMPFVKALFDGVEIDVGEVDMVEGTDCQPAT